MDNKTYKTEVRSCLLVWYFLTQPVNPHFTRIIDDSSPYSFLLVA